MEKEEKASGREDLLMMARGIYAMLKKDQPKWRGQDPALQAPKPPPAVAGSGAGGQGIAMSANAPAPYRKPIPTAPTSTRQIIVNTHEREEGEAGEIVTSNPTDKRGDASKPTTSHPENSSHGASAKQSAGSGGSKLEYRSGASSKRPLDNGPSSSSGGHHHRDDRRDKNDQSSSRAASSSTATTGITASQKPVSAAASTSGKPEETKGTVSKEASSSRKSNAETSGNNSSGSKGGSKSTQEEAALREKLMQSLPAPAASGAKTAESGSADAPAPKRMRSQDRAIPSDDRSSRPSNAAGSSDNKQSRPAIITKTNTPNEKTGNTSHGSHQGGDRRGYSGGTAPPYDTNTGRYVNDDNYRSSGGHRDDRRYDDGYNNVPSNKRARR